MSIEQNKNAKQSVAGKGKKVFTFLKVRVVRFVERLQEKLRALDVTKRKKLITIIFLGGGVFLAVWLVLVFSFMGKHTVRDLNKENITQQAVLMQKKAGVGQQHDNVVLLKTIEAKLTQLQQKPQQDPAAEVNHQALLQLASQLSVLIQSEQKSEILNQDKVDALERSQDSMVKQNNEVKAQISAIHKAVVPAQYLSLSVLPFTVQGLSFWNGQPMVTISMMGMGGQPFYKLIGQGNEYGCSFHREHQTGCRSWIVQSININTGVVIFSDHQGQLVRVSL